MKLLRASDVDAILARKLSLNRNIHIRRDLSRDAGAKQAVLMKERWKLISSGVDRKDIKIGKDKLLVAGFVYGALDPTNLTKFNTDTHTHTDEVPTPVHAQRPRLQLRVQREFS